MVLVVVAFCFDSEQEKTGVYVYDPAANAWSAEARPIPEKLSGNRKPKNGFYDPTLNAVLLYTAGDSQDDGVMWAYRYRR